MRTQLEILDWAVETFGPVARDRQERTMRFAEEAIELAHAMGLHGDVLVSIIRRVYSREAGQIPREIGQAQMTLEALAAVVGENADLEAEREFMRVKSVPKEEWTRRHQAKVAIGIAAAG